MKKNRKKICFTQSDFICAFQICWNGRLDNFSNWLAWRSYVYAKFETLSALDEETCFQRVGWRVDREQAWWENVQEANLNICCDSIYVKNVKHSHARDTSSNSNNPYGNFEIESSRVMSRQMANSKRINWQNNLILPTLFIFGAFQINQFRSTSSKKKRLFSNMKFQIHQT